MDRLKWDSGICDEYLASLQRISQCLNEQIQRLTAARRSIMRQGVTAGDKTLHEILDRLEAALKKLHTQSDRVRHLMDSLELSMDIFRSVEKKVGAMGTDMLYTGVMRGGLGPILVTPYTNPFTGRNVTPDWLSQIAGAAGT